MKYLSHVDKSVHLFKVFQVIQYYNSSWCALAKCGVGKAEKSLLIWPPGRAAAWNSIAHICSSHNDVTLRLLVY